MNIHKIIFMLYPSVVTIRGDEAFDVDGNPVIYDQNVVQDYINKTAHITKRQAEYPPITDYLDGVVKGDKVQIQAYIDACQAVKAKYPKP